MCTCSMRMVERSNGLLTERAKEVERREAAGDDD